jgi:8-oxo-dGTP pyrophosphatase MutT (NUDIX family)
MDGEWYLLYIRRSEHLQDHRGQVAFPGGAKEASDRDLEETALREAEEEVGIHPTDVRLLGVMDEFLTISDFLVMPFVGVIPWPYSLRISQDEVAQVFHVPLRWLSAPANFSIRPTELRGGVVDVIYYEPYEGQVLWGITALITIRLLKILRDFNCKE